MATTQGEDLRRAVGRLRRQDEVDGAVVEPYVGFDSYDERRADLLGGRDNDIRELVSSARVSALTIVYGPSGVGKSSLLRAGLAPALAKIEPRPVDPEDEDPDYGERLVAVYFNQWQRTDFQQALVMKCVAALRALDLEMTSPAPDMQLDQLVQTVCVRRPRLPRVRFILIFDQFEDYLITRPAEPVSSISPLESEEGRGVHFDRVVARIVNRADLTANIVLAIKDDDLARLDRFRLRIAHLFANTVRLDPLDEKGADEAMRKPLRVFNERAAEGDATTIPENDDPLPEVIKASKETDRIEPAFLQVVMQALWKKETEIRKKTGAPRLLRLSTLKGMGSAEKVIDDYVSTRLQPALTSRELWIASAMFAELVNPRGEKIAQPIEWLAQRPIPWYRRGPFRPAPAATTNLWPRALDVLAKLVAVKIVRQVGDNKIDLYHLVLARSVMRWRLRFEQKSRERMRTVAVGVGGLLVALAAGVLGLWGQAQHEVATDATNRWTAAKAGEDMPPRRYREALGLALYANRRDLVASALETPKSLLLHHVQQTSGVTFVSVDSRELLAAASADRTVSFWDPRTHTRVGVFAAHSDSVNAVAFRPAFGELITSGDDGTAKRWRLKDVLTGSAKPLTTYRSTILKNEIWAVNTVGPYVFTGDKFGNVTQWDAEQGTVIRKLPGTGDMPIVSIAVTEDGRRVAAGGFDKIVRVWDVQNGALLQRLAGHVDYVYGVSFAGDGRLASSSWDGSVLVWDASRMTPILSLLTPDRMPLWGVAFSRYGTQVAAATRKGALAVWDSWTGELLQQQPRDDAGMLTSVAFSGDSSIVAAGSAGGPVVVFQLMGLRDMGSRPSLVAFAATADRLVASYDTVKAGQPTRHHVGTWNTEGQPAHADLPLEDELQKQPIASVGLSSTGRVVIAGARNNAAMWAEDDNGTRLVPLVTASPLAGCQRQHAGEIHAVAVEQDAKEITAVTGGWDNHVNVWKVVGTSVQQIDCVDYLDTVHAVALSADRKTVIVGGANDKTGSKVAVYVRDVAGHTTTLLPIGEPKTVSALAFHSESGNVAAGFEDGSLLIWNVKQGPAASSLLGHGTKIVQLAFNRDGSKLASAGGDKSVRVWGVPSGDFEVELPQIADPVGVKFIARADFEELFVVSADNTTRHEEIRWPVLLNAAREMARLPTDCKRYFGVDGCPASLKDTIDGKLQPGQSRSALSALWRRIFASSSRR